MTCLQHVRARRDCQRGVNVLIHQQDGCPYSESASGRAEGCLGCSVRGKVAAPRARGQYLGVGEDFARISLCQNLSLNQQKDSVADCQNCLHDMLYNDNGGTARF
jgi:hypothetical protein